MRQGFRHIRMVFPVHNPGFHNVIKHSATHKWSVLLTADLVISLGFDASGSHADVRGMEKTPETMLRLMFHAANEGHK